MIAQIDAEVSRKCSVVKGEIGACQQHEEDDYGLDVDAVKGGDAGVARRESPDGHGAEGVAERVEEVHASRQQKKGLQRRQSPDRRPTGSSPSR